MLANCAQASTTELLDRETSTTAAENQEFGIRMLTIDELAMIGGGDIIANHG